MAKLPRVPQVIFAGSLAPTNNIAEFASTVTGTPVYTGDIATIMSLSAWLSGGMAASLISTGGGLNSPVFQELNGIFKVLSQQLQYLLLQGVPEWNATDQYFQYQIQSVNGQLYMATATNTNVNPVGDLTGTWVAAIAKQSSPNLCKAFVNFNGSGGLGACVLGDALNVTSVIKNGVGDYTVNFTNAMTTNTYAVGGGGTHGASGVPGQNPSILAEWAASNALSKTLNAVRVSTGGSPGDVAEDVLSGNVFIFGV